MREETSENSDALFDRESRLNVESYFCEILYLERKRTERLGHPFLLILIDINGLQINKRKSAIKILSETLTLSMREVDHKGWYKKDSVIGAIFTGVGTSQINIIRNKLDETLKKEIRLDQLILQNIVMTYHLFPENRDEDGNHSRLNICFYPEIQVERSKKKIERFIKRFIDVIGAIGGLVLFCPVFLVAPLLIKLASGGPVFFKQSRIGQYGKTFTFLKFRTMYNNNDQNIHKEYVKKLIREQKNHQIPGDRKDDIYKIKDDTRVTVIGRLLRKTSLDEIPQFLNVLAGEMSLVGPRPCIPYELENYDLWHIRRVLEFKPGITGLWQVKGRSRTSFNEMVRLDIQYIRSWSIWLDIKLICLTPWSMITAKGAY